MKKALLFFLGVVFVCCIYAYGTNERFSVEKWLENVKQISETATIEDLTSCWTKESYPYDASTMPYSIDVYDIRDVEGGGMIFYYRGNFPLAYNEDGSLTKKHPYEWRSVYNSDGTWNKNEMDPSGLYPVILKHGQLVYFEEYQGNSDVLQWLDTMVGFFKRLGRTIKLFADMVLHVFRNMRLLLPWNATVPIT